jgi:GMP synthase-like glutamine amidotransferase
MRIEDTLTTPAVAFLLHNEWDLPGMLGARAAEQGFFVASYRADRRPDALPSTSTFDMLVVMGSAESVNDRGVAWIGPERTLVAEPSLSAFPYSGSDSVGNSSPRS